VLKHFVEGDGGLSQEHIQPDQSSVHHGEDQSPHLQHPGQQFEGAFLFPLRGSRLLDHRSGKLLLPHLNNSVHVAGAVLAFRPQAPGPQDSHLDVCRHPSLLIRHD
uniref:Uncharacterized protein n=1 Tax=Lepisosteus oculatus TaxID=7918 RepID=W5MSL0_LEPOC